MKKRTISVAVAAVMALSLAACGSGSSTAASSESTAASSEAASSTAVSSEAAGSDFDATQKITVVSREYGSGTRGAFVELTGVEEKNDAGEKVDNTTVDATVANSTNNVMQTVQAD